jgi:hypothetical protein
MSSESQPSEQSKPSQIDPQRSVARQSTGISRYEVWTLTISSLALIVSLSVGFFSIYLPHFHVSRDFRASVFGLAYAWDTHEISVELVFSNEGNQHEVVIGSYFELPLDEPISGRFWPNIDVPRKRLAPITLAPGQKAHRRLVQRLLPEDAVSMKRANMDSASTWHSSYQTVAIGITVQDTGGRPRHHTLPLLNLSLGNPRHFVRGDHSAADSLYGDFTNIDLLTQGEIRDGPSLSRFELVPGDE